MISNTGNEGVIYSADRILAEVVGATCRVSSEIIVTGRLAASLSDAKRDAFTRP